MRKTLAVALLAVASLAQAQGIQTKECSKGCNFSTDALPVAGTGTTAVSCALLGFPGGASPLVKPVVDGTTITPPQAAGPTCSWSGVVLAPGSYSLTATWTAADGRVSGPSLPLSLTVSAPPLGAPTNLRIAP